MNSVANAAGVVTRYKRATAVPSYRVATGNTGTSFICQTLYRYAGILRLSPHMGSA
jgi:hypothetical protein